MLASGKLRWLARFLGVVGIAVAMLVFWAFREQTNTEKQGPRVTVTTVRYTEPTRIAAGLALLLLPVAAGYVMVSMWRSDRRGLRARVPLHLKEGRKHQVQKEYEAALRAYNQAIRIAPELGEAYYWRGSVHGAMGETARALADLDSALERDTRLAPAYLARGKLRTATGDLNGALADFGELLRIQANDPEFYLHRGICLEKKGLLDDAMADFHRVLKLTNHSDFADPAKVHLGQCQQRVEESARSAGGNGAPAYPAAPQPRAL
jgi:tetratricopeptide (TPR) repeat protein